jgi:predicted lipoprotein with Yx(FWY)xxD motif
MRAHRSHLTLALGLAAVLTLAACGGDDSGSSAGTTAASAATTAPAAATTAASGAATTAASGEQSGAEVLTTTSGALGTFLTDAEGRTVYVFLSDSQGKPSTCSGACAENWPAVLTDGAPKGEGDVDAGMLGTVAGADGKTQVTYDGWPLYYFIGDAKAGDATGQGAGDVWFVVGPDGAAIKTKP